MSWQDILFWILVCGGLIISILGLLYSSGVVRPKHDDYWDTHQDEEEK